MAVNLVVQPLAHLHLTLCELTSLGSKRSMPQRGKVSEISLEDLLPQGLVADNNPS